MEQNAVPSPVRGGPPDNVSQNSQGTENEGGEVSMGETEYQACGITMARGRAGRDEAGKRAGLSGEGVPGLEPEPLNLCPGQC